MYRNKQGEWTMSPKDRRIHNERMSAPRPAYVVYDWTKHRPSRLISMDVREEYQRLLEDLAVYRARYYSNLRFKNHMAAFTDRVMAGRRTVWNSFNLALDVECINDTQARLRNIRYYAKSLGIRL